MKKIFGLLTLLFLYSISMEAISYSTTPVTSIQSMAWYGIYSSENYRYISTQLSSNNLLITSSSASSVNSSDYHWEIKTLNNSYALYAIKNNAYLRLQKNSGSYIFQYGDAIEWELIHDNNTIFYAYSNNYYFGCDNNKKIFMASSSQKVALELHKLYATNFTVGSALPLTFSAHNADGYWATFSSTTPVLMDTLVSPYAIVFTENEFQLVRFEKAAVKETSTNTVHIGYLVPANTGVLLHCASATGTYYLVSADGVEAITDVSENLLRPSSEMQSAIGDNSNYYFKLAYGSSSDTDLGWYWGADGGAPFTITNSNSAYLRIPKDAPADALQGLILTKEMIENAEELTSEQEIEESVETEEPTAIEETSTGSENVDSDAIYNLLGQPVTHPQPGQIYIQNRKKYVIQ